MSEQRKFFKASSHYLLSQIAVLGISLISFPIVVRLLSIEDYGVLSLCNTILLFAVALSKLGFQHSIIRFYPDYQKQNRVPCFFRSYATVGVLSGFVFFGVSGLVTKYSVPSELTGISWLVAGIAFTQTLYSYLINFLRSQERSTTFSILGVANRLLSSFGGIALVLLLSNSLFGLFQAQFVTYLILVTLLIILFRKCFIGGDQIFSSSLIVTSLRFGLPLVAYEMSSVALAFSDRFLIGHFNGMKELGIYAVGYTLCMYIGDLLRQPVKMAVGPMYTRIYLNEGAEKASEFISEVIKIIALIAFPIFFGCVAIRNDLIILLASNKYSSAAQLIPWVLGGLLLYAAQPVISAGLFLKKKTVSIAVISLICVMVDIVSNYFLLPRFGVIAAAWSTAGSYTLAVFITYFVSSRALTVKWPFVSIVKYCIASIVMYLCIYLLAERLSLFPEILAGIFIYTMLVLLLDCQLRSNIYFFINRRR